MASYKVVVTDQVFPDVALERELLKREIDASLEVADGTREGALALARDADALLNTYLPIDADFLGQLERCKVVARYGIGVDNVDVAAAAQRGVTITNVPDYCVEEVALHALSLLLALVRKLPESDVSLRGGGWGVGDVRPLRRFSDMTVGLVGYGKIARTLAASLHQLGCAVLAQDPYVTDPGDGTEMVELEALLRRADAVSLHAPLTPETRGLIGRKQLDLLGADGILVNTSRGPLVVLDDLLDALREGRLGAAGLDVFEVEPPDPSRLEGVPHLLTSPHTAFYSEQSLQESQRKAATQIIKVLTGAEPDYAIRP